MIVIEGSVPLYMIQLAAFRSEKRASEMAEILSQKHKARLGGVDLKTMTVDNGSNGIFHRIVSVPMLRQDADKVCSILRRSGQDCFIRKYETTTPNRCKPTGNAFIMTDIKDSLISTEVMGSQPKQLSLFLDLDGFEGPIDMLLQLARDQKVDLRKIAILPLAEQYLAFVNNVRELDLEVAADYLVMAAWLAYMKSRLLLPDPDPEQTEEVEDMADALRHQLLRLEAMQRAAKCLLARPKLGHQRFVRGAPEDYATSLNLFGLPPYMIY